MSFKKINELELKFRADGSESIIIRDGSSTKRLESGELMSGRIFSPIFGVNAYWGEASDIYGNHFSDSITNMRNDIKTWDEHRCDEIIVPIHLSYNKNNKEFYIVEDLDTVLEGIQYCSGFNIKVTVIKVHLQRVTEDDIMTHGINDFKEQYKSLLSTIANTFRNSSITIMTVLNELGWLYESSDHLAFCKECLNIAKTVGYLTGVTCAGFSNFFKIKKDIIDNSDKIFVNSYPRVSAKKDETSLDDVISGFSCNNDLKYIRKIKKCYPGKPIIISECGVQDYWEALMNPEHWKWGEYGFTATNGVAPGYYLAGLFETFNIDGVESVWWWYDLRWEATKKTTDKYLKGGK